MCSTKLLRITGIMAAACWLGQATAPASDFGSSTNVNVLREYNFDGTRAGSQTADFTGVTYVSTGSVNGAGSRTQAGSFVAGAMVSETYTLSAAETVGSWNLQNLYPSYYGTSMVLSGLTGSGWVQLDSFTPTAVNSITRTFTTPQTVTALKYVATGPNLASGADFLLYEIQVFADAGSPQPLYGQHVGATTLTTAHNLIRDVIPSAVASTNQSIIGSGWLAPDTTPITDWSSLYAGSPGNPTNIIDGDYTQTFVIAPGVSNPPTNIFAYVKLDFSQKVQMNLAHLGFYEGQSWDNYALFASALASPDANSPSDWVQIYSTTGNSGQEQLINFAANADQYQHLLLMWKNGASIDQTGALNEFELFGFESQIPEPSIVLLLALGGLLVGRRAARR